MRWVNVDWVDIAIDEFGELNYWNSIFQVNVPLRIVNKCCIRDVDEFGHGSMDYISTLWIAILNSRIFINRQVATTSDCKDRTNGPSTVLQEWLAHIHLGTVIQIEEASVDIVLSRIQECFIQVIYAHIIESRIWTNQCDSMIDFQSNIINKSGITNLNIWVENIHQISRRLVVNKPRISDILNLVNIVLCIDSGSVICPVLLECAIIANHRRIWLK